MHLRPAARNFALIHEIEEKLRNGLKSGMDDVFQQYRLKQIDLNAAVQKEKIRNRWSQPTNPTKPQSSRKSIRWRGPAPNRKRPTPGCCSESADS